MYKAQAEASKNNPTEDSKAKSESKSSNQKAGGDDVQDVDFEEVK